MGKNTKAGKTDQQKKKTAPKAPGQAPAATAPENKGVNSDNHENVEDAQVIEANAMNPGKILANRRRGGLSPDATVQALDLAHRVFVEERDPDLQFPKETAIKVNKIVAVGILCTLADHATNGEDSFATVLNTQAYPSLASAAEDLGFKIPDIKALPAGKEEGTVMIPANKVKVPEETKKKLQEEKKIREGEKPELDPEKITSEEDLTKALTYMFVQQKGTRLTSTLLEGVDFMKKFRMHEASLAENADEAKAKFESYNTGDWLDDLFKYVQPSVFFTGIGRGMAECTAIAKDPIHAFCIFRDAIKNKETGEPVLSDQEIAYCAKSIITWYCKVNIESNEKTIEGLDAKKNAKEIESCKNRIDYLNNIINIVTNPTTDNVDTLLENVGHHTIEGTDQYTDECARANRIVNVVGRSYYGKQLSPNDYKNLYTNIQQYAGCIVNLFRNPGAKSKVYDLSNIKELEEYTEEEKKANLKAAKAEKEAQNSKNA